MIDAITFIRLKSQRVPSKSVKKLNGVPLCNYALKVMNEVPEIDNIIVYASNEDICKYIDSSVKYTFKKRPERLDSNSATFNTIMDYAINLINSKYVLYFCVTSPFMKPETISEMINKVVKEDYDSAFTVKEIRNFCWFKNKPLNYDPNIVPFTQDLEAVLVETSGLYIFGKDLYLQTRRRIGFKPYIKRVGIIEGHDIDYIEDFKIAECFIKGELI
jgi:CMP-N-acetylneuraminic acid synthetase